jgi:hypothetical protein
MNSAVSKTNSEAAKKSVAVNKTNSGPDKMTVEVRKTNSEAGKMHSGGEPEVYVLQHKTKRRNDKFYTFNSRYQ